MSTFVSGLDEDSVVQTYVTSSIHLRLGADASKLRWSTFSTGGPCGQPLKRKRAPESATRETQSWFGQVGAGSRQAKGRAAGASRQLVLRPQVYFSATGRRAAYSSQERT